MERGDGGGGSLGLLFLHSLWPHCHLSLFSAVIYLGIVRTGTAVSEYGGQGEPPFVGAARARARSPKAPGTF